MAEIPMSQQIDDHHRDPMQASVKYDQFGDTLMMGVYRDSVFEHFFTPSIA